MGDLAAAQKILDDLQVEKICGELIGEAGKLLLSYRGQAAARVKGPFDILTDADLALESLILGRLTEKFPGWQIISEEKTAKGAQTLSEFCWVLDPLDGTVNFALGLPSFGISMALLHHGDPIIGWVADPLHDELFFARRGRGSYLNGRRLSVDVQPPPILVLIDTNILDWAGTLPDASRLTELIRTFGKTRNLGSQALHLCYVAAGRGIAALTMASKIWDDAAGSLIVHESGGMYVSWSGGSVFPLKAGDSALAGGGIRSIATVPNAVEKLSYLLNN
jgi:myo-inositol-1(or 4)-monophosphatase